jgi:uncharacterized protein DUF2637
LSTISTPAPSQDRRADIRPSGAARQAADRVVFTAAGACIAVLTVGGFWLSYAHLAQIAGQHGLGDSPARRWAWPATLDAFIVAGELLMLRAGLRRVTDGWAIAFTSIGSVGSIALNVAGVNGSGKGAHVPLLDYVVAGVPPTAALLAFGMLMRQILQLVDRRAHHTASGTEPVPSPALSPSAAEEVSRTAITTGQPPESEAGVSTARSRGGRPASATVEELVEIGRIAVAEQGTLSRNTVQQAIRAKGHTVSGARLTEVMNALRSETDEAPPTVPIG